MSLIPVTPPESKPTAELAVESVIEGSNASFAERLRIRRTLWETVWRNPRSGASPQEVVSAMGTKAKLIFTASALDAAFFNQLAAAKGVPIADLVGAENVELLSLPPQWSVSFAPDGSATLTAQ